MVAVIVIQNHKVIIASAGRGDEPSSLVGVDLFGGLDDGAEALEGFGEVGGQVEIIWRWSSLSGAMEIICLVDRWFIRAWSK
jgi:hypothetical protein